MLFFFVDVVFCFGMDEQFEIEICFYNVFVKQICFGGFGNGMVQINCCFDIFVMQEDVVMVSFQCKCGDEYIFYQQVWQLFY